MPPIDENNPELQHPLEVGIESLIVQNTEMTDILQESNLLLQSIALDSNNNDIERSLELQMLQTEENHKETLTALKELQPALSEAISNIPQPDTPDFSETNSLLSTMIEEIKKKEDIEIEIDEETRSRLRGDKGDTGERGERGPKGRDGKDGLDGTDGRDGKDGISPVIDDKVTEKIVKKIKTLTKEGKGIKLKEIEGGKEIIREVGNVFAQTYNEYDLNGVLLANGPRVDLKAGTGITLTGRQLANGAEYTITSNASEADTLQSVTDRGATTTNTITAQGFIGDGSQLTNITNFSRTTHGVVNLPAITNNGDGTVNIASTADINIMSTADGKTGNLLRFTDVTGGLINTLTDGNVNYIYIDYNGGNPIYKVTTSPAIFINTFNLVPVFRISREGTSLYILDYDEFGIGLADKAFYKDVALHSVERQTGIVLSTTATRISTVTGGVVWFGVTYKTLPTNTAGSSGTLYEYYLTGSVWSRSLVTSYDATYYSDGTNRQTLGNNKYVAKYFYRDTSDNEVYYIHGGAHNTASEAFNEAVPTAPITMTAHSFYVGKIVIQKNATNGTAYPRAWDTSINAAVPVHNDLAGLQGGIGGEYYHLTNAEKTVVVNTSGTNTGDQVGDGVTITGAGTVADPFVAVGGGSQTPWTSDIDADGYSLNDVENITATGTIKSGVLLVNQEDDLSGAKIQASTPVYTVGNASSASGSINYGDGGYTNGGFTHRIRVYAYKDSPEGRVYSPSYVQSSAVIDDGGWSTNYSITWSWSPASGADGYIVIKNDDSNGFDYNYYVDITDTSFVDDNYNSWQNPVPYPMPTNVSGKIAKLTGEIDVTGSINLSGSQSITGGLQIDGTQTVTGSASFASGLFRINSDGSVGQGASAGYPGSFALGENAHTTGNYGYAYGYNATAGTYGYAYGHYASAGTYGLATGFYATAAASSIAYGYYTFANGGSGAIAFGSYANASGASSLALGFESYAGGLQSIAIGRGARVSRDYEISIANLDSTHGIYNGQGYTQFGIVNGWASFGKNNIGLGASSSTTPYTEYPYAGSYTLANTPIQAGTITGSTNNGALTDDGAGNLYAEYWGQIATIDYNSGVVTDITGAVYTESITYNQLTFDYKTKINDDGSASFANGEATIDTSGNIAGANLSGTNTGDQDLAGILSGASITPIADGTYTFDAVNSGSVTSITFTSGIATAITTL